MCGRFTLTTPVGDLAELFDVEGPLPKEISPRYNVAPSREVLAVGAGRAGERKMRLLQWGLVPSWAKEPINPGPINARAETVAEKPSFRRAFRKRRALILADGYFEWKKQPKGPKQPYYFTVKGGEPFAFAAVWEVWRGSGGEEVRSCAIITTCPNPLAAEIHDRMPVVLPPEHHEEWLDPGSDPEGLLRLLVPYPESEMEARPVSTHVNSPSNDDERCIAPAA